MTRTTRKSVWIVATEGTVVSAPSRFHSNGHDNGARNRSRYMHSRASSLDASLLRIIIYTSVDTIFFPFYPPFLASSFFNAHVSLGENVVGEVNKVVFREREELVIGSSSWLDEKGGGKACSRLFVRSTGNGSVGTIVLGVESHENELAFRLPFYCILCILRIVIERERERLQGTNVIIDLSRHNERSRARFSNPSLPPSHYPKLPESSSN